MCESLKVAMLTWNPKLVNTGTDILAPHDTMRLFTNMV